MRILIACEYSGVVRTAFEKRGHHAVSCDFLPTELPGEHIRGNVIPLLKQDWDMMIAFPPCTYLTHSGNRWFTEKELKGKQYKLRLREQAVDLFLRLANANIPKIAIENPVGIMNKLYRKPDQIIHPHFFGHPISKRTCLWLKNLPVLNATNIIGDKDLDWVYYGNGKRHSGWYESVRGAKKAHRRTVRSKTFQGIADAMADQWG